MTILEPSLTMTLSLLQIQIISGTMLEENPKT